MSGRNEQGRANVTAILMVIGFLVASVWAWKRIPADTQDFVVEQAIPLAALGALGLWALWSAISRVRRRRQRRLQRGRLIGRFESEPSADKRRDLAFALIEMNGYKLEGLERVALTLIEIFRSTLKTAVGDKQHRLRGMAASYIGVLQDKSVIPLLLAALEDDHAYVRSCAALGLGRLRAAEAKQKLTHVMEEDWDQTVRSRAREALERIA